MSPITTHVLDTATGKPAVGISIALDRQENEGWAPVSFGVTNSDGRITDLMKKGDLKVGSYRMTFETAEYFSAQKCESFYPVVTIEFSIDDESQHYHVPLLLSPFGYSTYRGS